MKLPLLVSVPHGGWRVPTEAEPYCILSRKEIEEDGDVGAREIYAFEPKVAGYVATDVARAIVDLNRAPDDRRPDGVVKTHTCWNVPVYREFPPESVIRVLLERYYHPYHAKLRELARTGVRLGIDCHTMAAQGPPVGPDPGKPRPHVCLSNADGTCPHAWIETLARCFEHNFGQSVCINEPFQGGYITRSHARELPWLQLELSRAAFMTDREKRDAVVESLEAACRELMA